MVNYSKGFRVSVLQRWLLFLYQIIFVIVIFDFEAIELQ
jgi:hypothetical protein